LDVDDGFRAGQALLEAGVVLLQAGQFGGQRVGFGGFPAAFGRGETADSAGLALAAPIGEVRGVEALPAQDGADAAGVGGTVDLGEDAQLVLCGEGAAARALGQFGRRCERCRHNRRPSASG